MSFSDNGDRMFFDRIASESTEEFVYCNLRNVIDTDWCKSKIRTLYVWNFCCRSQNADVDCSLRNLREQRENDSHLNFKRKGVQMRSLIHQNDIDVTNSLIFDVFQHLKLGNILDFGDENEYLNVKYLYESAEKSFMLSHIWGYDESNVATNYPDEESFGLCLVRQSNTLFEK